MIYLDNNATTRVAPEVLDAMQPYLSDIFGNPSSAHALGREMKRAIEQSREQVANLIGAAAASEIVFTSCGSESDNWAGMPTCQTVSARLGALSLTSREGHPHVGGAGENFQRAVGRRGPDQCRGDRHPGPLRQGRPRGGLPSRSEHGGARRRGAVARWPAASTA